LDGVDLGTNYRFDVKKFWPDGKKRSYPLMSMLDQVDRIQQCFNKESSWLKLTEVFPELFEIQQGLSEYRQ